MTLNEYIKLLQKLKKNHGEKEVWYARDDEGNGYNMIFYAPGIIKKEDGEDIVCIN